MAELPKTMLVIAISANLDARPPPPPPPPAGTPLCSTTRGFLKAATSPPASKSMLGLCGSTMGFGLQKVPPLNRSRLMWSPSQEGAEVLEARRLCSRRRPSAHHARQRCYGTRPQITSSLVRLCRRLTTSSTDQGQSMRCLRNRSPYS